MGAMRVIVLSIHSPPSRRCAIKGKTSSLEEVIKQISEVYLCGHDNTTPSSRFVCRPCLPSSVPTVTLLFEPESRRNGPPVGDDHIRTCKDDFPGDPPPSSYRRPVVQSQGMFLTSPQRGVRDR